MELLVKLLSSTAKVPTKAHESDAGYDLYANETVAIAPGQTVRVGTGVAMMPVCKENVAGLIWDRSSMGSQGIHKLAGVIDQTYTGEICIVLTNLNTGTIFNKIFTLISLFLKCVSSKGYLFSFDTVNSAVNKHIDEILKSEYYTINAGDKIAQIIYQPVLSGPIRVVDDLIGERGEKGFGSSGS